jgi:sulfotransferase family protein
MTATTKQPTTAAYLDAGQIFDQTARETQLQDYADQQIRARFIDLVDQFNSLGKVPGDSLAAAIGDMKRAVTIRLQLARDWTEHPEILEQNIVQPIFILGNGRAGTTLSQSLLSLDEGHRTPRFMDAQCPSPPRGLDRAADAAARRTGDAYVDEMLDREPGLLVSHPYHDKGGMAEAEDEYLYSLDFNSVYPLHFQHVPTLPPTQAAADPLAAFAFYRNMLCQLQWKTPTRRWVGKGIRHQYLAGPLLQAFPDAIGVWIHRSPEELIPSYIKITELVYRPIRGSMYSLNVDHLVAGLKAGTDKILNDPAINDPRISHVRFADMVKDPVAVIAGVYETHGLVFTAAYEKRIRDWLADPVNRVDRHGKFRHSAEEYGLDPAELKRLFADYRDRFL